MPIQIMRFLDFYMKLSTKRRGNEKNNLKNILVDKNHFFQNLTFFI